MMVDDTKWKNSLRSTKLAIGYYYNYLYNQVKSKTKSKVLLILHYRNTLYSITFYGIEIWWNTIFMMIEDKKFYKMNSYMSY